MIVDELAAVYIKISELHNENLVLKDKIAELEAINNKLKEPIPKELRGNQAKRELEMKAQGVSELAETMVFKGHLQNTLSYDEVCDFSKELLKQAGDL